MIVNILFFISFFYDYKSFYNFVKINTQSYDKKVEYGRMK
jgi:hypothetical protein